MSVLTCGLDQVLAAFLSLLVGANFRGLCPIFHMEIFLKHYGCRNPGCWFVVDRVACFTPEPKPGCNVG
jgi:hypothetical protein